MQGALGDLAEASVHVVTLGSWGHSAASQGLARGGETSPRVKEDHAERSHHPFLPEARTGLQPLPETVPAPLLQLPHLKNGASLRAA